MEFMEILRIVLIVLEVIASVALIVVVSLQSGKEGGMGALTGNNSSYLSKSKFGNMDKILSTATKWVALAWIVLTMVLAIID